MSAGSRVQLERLREQLASAGYVLTPVGHNPEHERPEFSIKVDGADDRTVWCEPLEEQLSYRWRPSLVDPIAPADDVDAAIRVIRAYLAAAVD